MEGKIITVAELFRRLVRADDSRRAASGGRAAAVQSPQFCFLIGAGFSLNAGVPSTGELVSALLKFEDRPGRPWAEIFDEVRGERAQGNSPPASSPPPVTAEYFDTIARVLPERASRHHFVTAAVQWAARRRPQLSRESILLSTILNAGTVEPDYVRTPEQLPGSRFAASFAQHVFTTNFDEVMPTTYYLVNKPVQVVDKSGLVELGPHAEYPTVVYLHGRHLHYDLRNTADEILEDPQRRQRGDLFDQFTSLVSRSGLIVLGYSGAEDSVMESIAEALQRSRGECRGVYWCVNSAVERLSPAARRLVEQHPDCYYLTPGENAETILKQICDELGIEHYSTISRYWKRLSETVSAVQSFMEANPVSLENYFSELLEVYKAPSMEAVQAVAARWESDFRTDFDKYSDADKKGEVLFFLAELHLVTGQAREAAQFFELALEQQRKAGQPGRIGNTLNRQGDLLLWYGDAPGAQRKYSEALELHREAEAETALAYDRKGLGDVLFWRGDLDGAEREFSAAHELHLRLEDSIGAANALNGLAEVALWRNELERALELYTQALTAHSAEGDRVGAAIDLNGLGEVRLQGGELELARREFEQARELHEAVGAELGLALDLRNLARVDLLEGQMDSAAERFNTALQIHSSCGDVAGAAYDRLGLAELELRQQRFVNAENLLAECLAEFERIQQQLGIWAAREQQALLKAARGDLEGALGELTALSGEALSKGYALRVDSLEKQIGVFKKAAGV